MHIMTELNGLRGFKREYMKLEGKHGGDNMRKVEKTRILYINLYYIHG